MLSQSYLQTWNQIWEKRGAIFHFYMKSITHFPMLSPDKGLNLVFFLSWVMPQKWMFIYMPKKGLSLLPFLLLLAKNAGNSKEFHYQTMYKLTCSFSILLYQVMPIRYLLFCYYMSNLFFYLSFAQLPIQSFPSFCSV